MKVVLRMIMTMSTKFPITSNTAIRTTYSIMIHVGLNGNRNLLKHLQCYYPDPSEASEMSSLLLISLELLLRKDNIVDTVLSMNTEQPDAFWNLCLASTRKNGGVNLEEELEMREGIGLMMGVASPC